jgi:ATP-dependent Clp protease ATP-binding subunit ClpC
MDPSEIRDFTEHARRVIDLARREAASLGHDYLASEHLLLGLASEGHGVAAHVLHIFGQDLGSLRASVRLVVGSGPLRLPARDFPWTPRMKLAVEYAREEVQCLDHRDVGTEHLLLGVLRVDDGVAVQLLLNAGINPLDVRHEVLAILTYEDLQTESPGHEP